MDKPTQDVIIVSGRSGGGKSTALNALEDLGYYCIDNLPGAMLPDFGPQISANPELYKKVALGIDARSRESDLQVVLDWMASLRENGFNCRLLFITADKPVLIKRFSETRRRHPLTGGDKVLPDAIENEKKLLESQGIEPETKLLAKRLDVKESEIIDMERRLDNVDLSLETPVREESNFDQKVYLKSNEVGIEEKIVESQYYEWFHQELDTFANRCNEGQGIERHRIEIIIADNTGHIPGGGHTKADDYSGKNILARLAEFSIFEAKHQQRQHQDRPTLANGFH